MSLSAAAIRILAEKGLSASDIADVVEAMGPAEHAETTADRKRAYDRQYRRDHHKNNENRTIRTNIVQKETFPHTPIQEKLYTPSPPKGGSIPSTTFADFWRAYPLKTGKGAAEKSYTKALLLISGPDPPGVLLLALERVKPTWREPKFIPHAATWLNQRRWEDEPETLNVLSLETRNERPHPSAKFLAKQANLERHFAGAKIAALRRAEQ